MTVTGLMLLSAAALMFVDGGEFSASWASDVLPPVNLSAERSGCGSVCMSKLERTVFPLPCFPDTCRMVGARFLSQVVKLLFELSHCSVPLSGRVTLRSETSGKKVQNSRRHFI